MITTQKQRRKMSAVSAILGMVMGIGITAGLGGGVYYLYQEQADLFATGSNIEVRNVSAIRDGDTLIITGTVKNVGQTSISQISIDSIRVSELVAKQNEDLILEVTGVDRENDPSTKSLLCADQNGNGSVESDSTCTGLVVSHEGFSLLDDSDTTANSNRNISLLEGGRTNAFKVELEALGAVGTTGTSDEIDISNSVNISDTMTLILKYNSGDDILFTEPYSARVRAG